MPEHNLTQSGWNVKYIFDRKKITEERSFILTEKNARFQLEKMAFFVPSACIYNVKMVHYNGLFFYFMQEAKRKVFRCFVIKFPPRNGC